MKATKDMMDRMLESIRKMSTGDAGAWDEGWLSGARWGLFSGQGLPAGQVELLVNAIVEATETVRRNLRTGQK
jgi:hypothetical protein